MRCEGLSIHLSEINIQNIHVVYPKVVILYGDSKLKKAVTCVRAVKVTLYVHENLKLTKIRRVNIQKTMRFKTNSKIKYMNGNINKAKIKMLKERDLLLIIILRGRRIEKRKPIVWVRQVY